MLSSEILENALNFGALKIVSISLLKKLIFSLVDINITGHQLSLRQAAPKAERENSNVAQHYQKGFRNVPASTNSAFFGDHLAKSAER